jgi:hypothetical protein
MLTFEYNEGQITLLFIPIANAQLSEFQREGMSTFLFTHNIPVPDWDEYNEILEGYLIEDFTEKKDCWDEVANDDDHIDSFFNIEEIDEYVTSSLRKLSGIEDLMFCRGIAGFCVLPTLTH